MNPRYALIVAAGIAAGAFLLGGRHAPPTPVQAPELDVAVMTTGLEVPWDMKWGPDNMIWVSERSGRIQRVDPATGKRSQAGFVGGVYQTGEGGLLGIAFHPDFATTPYLYAMHSYSVQAGQRNRLVRMHWDGTTLGAPEVLFDNIPGGSIHNGSRIVVGPDRMLYISTGEAGNTSNAQDSTSFGGKILRLTLDGKPAPGNPFGNATWTWGHRNPQGLVFHPRTGVLYETEHGAADNDEVNIIERGRNYGWPTVHGECDEAAEKVFCREHNVREPLISWTPTVAIAGADLYLSDRIPSLTGSLIAASLGGRTLWQLKLSPDGTRITDRVKLLSVTYGRLRDVLVGPDGTIYVCTSNRDGRGSPSDDDDRILRITAKK